MSRVPIDEILELPAAERMEIIGRIWESVVAEYPYPGEISAAQCRELDRRWEKFKEDPDQGEPWEDVEKSLLSEPGPD
ncbi:MAG TPA: addiction module protein [Thermoanaerobaculia bacterium]|nr:addiction module protein [Thermoanaerobaculia bacterium]